MIPDKIYTFQDEGDRYWYKPEEWETPPLTRVEYIRKDALLEWARETKAELEKQNVIKDDIRKGAVWELEEVIKKIESL